MKSLAWLGNKFSDEANGNRLKRMKDRNKPVAPTPKHNLRPLVEDDIVDIAIKLRKLLAAYQTNSYALMTSFVNLDTALEVEAEKARHTLELSTLRIAAVCEKLEETDVFKKRRDRILSTRKKQDMTYQGDDND